MLLRQVLVLEFVLWAEAAELVPLQDCHGLQALGLMVLALPSYLVPPANSNLPHPLERSVLQQELIGLDLDRLALGRLARHRLSSAPDQPNSMHRSPLAVLMLRGFQSLPLELEPQCQPISASTHQERLSAMRLLNL